MKMEIEGLPELEKLLRKMPKEVEKVAMKELQRSAVDLQGKAQLLAPVDMGDLRGSGFSETKGQEVTVGFSEPYALKQHEELEYNHPKGGQAKYLEQPYKENVKHYINDISKKVKKAVSKRGINQ